MSDSPLLGSSLLKASAIDRCSFALARHLRVVSLEEATELTGLPKTSLRRFIADGRLAEIRDKRIKMRRTGVFCTQLPGTISEFFVNVLVLTL